MSQQKVFCIGMNKTGTTSIGDALNILGYKRLGWKKGVSGPLTLRWHEGKYSKFFEVAEKYDVFEDIPWCLVYKEMYERYPDAKFILTTRKSEEVWLNSIQKHIGRIGTWVGQFLVYGSYDPVSDPEMFLKRYREHNDSVRSFFSDKPGQLKEVCFEEGSGWEDLCSFLGKDIPERDFPHKNKSPN